MFEFLKKKKESLPFVSAVLAAGGNSSRMGGVNKLLEPLGDLPVIAHSLLALEESDYVEEIVIAASQQSLIEISEICRELGLSKPIRLINGGRNRAESVYKALCECSAESKYALVQDGARPCITQEFIRDTCEQAFLHHCATVAVPVKDTIKIAEDGLIRQTPDRRTLYAVQTPQVTDIDLLKGALVKAAQEGLNITDDCSAVEYLGIHPVIVPGGYFNIKITTPEDLVIAEALLEYRMNQME